MTPCAARFFGASSAKCQASRVSRHSSLDVSSVELNSKGERDSTQDSETDESRQQSFSGREGVKKSPIYGTFLGC